MTSLFKQHKKVCICLAVVLILAAVAAVGISVWKGSDSAAEGSTKQNAIRLSKMDLAKSVSATGTLESCKSKTVTTGVNNITVKKVHAAVGDSVKKGDTLVTFDQSDLNDTLSEAKENLDDAKSEADRSVASAKNKVSDAEAAYASEKVKLAQKVTEAKTEKARAKKQAAKIKKQVTAVKDVNEKANLSEQLAKANESVQQAESACENALENQTASNKQNQAAIDSAKEALETAQRNGEKSVKEAERQVKEARKNLAECTVSAPMGGIVTDVSVEEGSVYSGGSVMQIEDVSSFVVTSSVDEYDIGKIETGQKVVILTEATGDEELEGEITFVAPAAGSGQSQQAENGSAGSISGYEVRIQLNSANDALKLGMTAKCSIILEEAEDVFAVPYDAVHENQDGTKVIYVQQGGNSGENRPAGKNADENRQFPGEQDRMENMDNDSSGLDEKDTASDYREITVTTGMESDYYVEISGDELEEGMRVLIPTDETASSSGENAKKEKDTAFSFGMEMPGNMGGNPPERKGNGR